MALLYPLSQVDKAFNDTLIRKAEGEAFDALAYMYGVPRLDFIAQKYWRKALQHVAFGPRGAPACTFAFIREALRGLDTQFDVLVDPDVSTKHQIGWGGVLGGGFSQKDLHRFWEIDGQIYLSTSWSTAPAPAAPYPILELSRFDGEFWSACDWSKDTSLIAGVPTLKKATRLPFTCRGRNAKFELYIDDATTKAPPTFLQVDYNWSMQYANGLVQPGIVWFPSTEKNKGDVEAVTVPYTGLFNPSIVPSTYAQVIVEETAELTRLDFFADVLDAVPARGGNYTATLYLNNVATGLSAVLGAAATHNFSVGSVNVVPGDLLYIAVESGAGVSAPLLHPTWQVHGSRPLGQPIGGEILPSQNVIAAVNQQGLTNGAVNSFVYLPVIPADVPTGAIWNIDLVITAKSDAVPSDTFTRTLKASWENVNGVLVHTNADVLGPLTATGNLVGATIASAAVGTSVQIACTDVTGCAALVTWKVSGQYYTQYAGDQTNGPYPLYLNDAGLAAWVDTLTPLLAAGVVPEVYAFDFLQPW